MSFDLAPAIARAQSVISGLIAAVPSIILALVVFGSFLLAAAVVRALTARLTETRLKAHRNAGLAVGCLAQGVVIFIGLLVAFSVALPTFSPGDAIQILGISSVAIGFAFRDILQNFLAGILLLVTQPCRIGDQIVAGSYEGTVEEIQTRATFIRTYDGRRVVLPKAELFKGTVVVNTAFNRRSRSMTAVWFVARPRSVSDLSLPRLSAQSTRDSSADAAGPEARTQPGSW